MVGKYCMRFGRVRLRDLVSPDYNPRSISGDEFERLKKSIRVFGYQDPLIVNESNNHIVAGNQRFRALKELDVESHGKYSMIDVVLVNISESDEKAFNIGHNRIGGEFDEVKLQGLLDELASEDYDLDLTGFVADYDLEEVVSEMGDGLGDGVLSPSSFVVTVKCGSVEDMNELHNRLKKQGYNVKSTVY